jgi:excisionase family DNA binding protein
VERTTSAALIPRLSESEPALSEVEGRELTTANCTIAKKHAYLNEEAGPSRIRLSAGEVPRPALAGHWDDSRFYELAMGSLVAPVLTPRVGKNLNEGLTLAINFIILPQAKKACPFRRKLLFFFMHNLLTVKETAKYLRIPLPTVYYLVQRGQLPAIQIGGRWRIKKASLDKDILKEDKSGQPTVLVVDDDESLQSLFKIFLKKIGFSRVVVGTVKEALAALEKQKFDLVFLDLKLPDGPADDVYEAAKEVDPDLPIVVITGYPDSEMLDRILARGPVTVLKKPLKIEQLQQTVRILGHKDAAKLAA